MSANAPTPRRRTPATSRPSSRPFMNASPPSRGARTPPRLSALTAWSFGGALLLVDRGRDAVDPEAGVADARTLPVAGLGEVGPRLVELAEVGRRERPETWDVGARRRLARTVGDPAREVVCGLEV